MSLFRLVSSPFSLSRLFHTPLAPKPVCGSADFPVAARYNLRLRVRSRQLNSGELDVTPMYLAIAMTTSRSGGVETRHTGTLTISTETPLQHVQSGGRTNCAGRVCNCVLCSVFSKQECTSHVHITQDTHYSSHWQPESQSSNSPSVT